jgi:hypothetical protein
MSTKLFDLLYSSNIGFSNNIRKAESIIPMPDIISKVWAIENPSQRVLSMPAIQTRVRL